MVNGRKFTLGFLAILVIGAMHVLGSLPATEAMAAIAAMVATTQGSIAYEDAARAKAKGASLPKPE